MLLIESMDEETQGQVVLEAEVVDEAPKKRKRGRPLGSKTNIPRATLAVRNAQRVLELKARGLTAKEIAKTVGQHEKTVAKLIAQFGSIFQDLKHVPTYMASRDQLLTAAEFTLLKSMVDSGKIRNANLYQSAYAFKQIHEARRLEQGLSTQNIANKVEFTALDLSKLRCPSEG